MAMSAIEQQTRVDLAAFSAHKLAGPKGTGALLIAGDVELESLVLGGGQESGLRAGTENVAGIIGFVEAAAIADGELSEEAPRLRELRDGLQSGLSAALPEIVVNGGDAPERLPNVLSISVPQIDIEGLLTSLDFEGICVSSGSACTTGSVEPSHVITAMGRTGELAGNTIRMSLGWGTTEDEIGRRFGGRCALDTVRRNIKIPAENQCCREPGKGGHPNET